MRIHRLWTVVALSLLSGCTGGAKPDSGTASSGTTSEAAHEHDHPSEGPHHGALIELGDEEYHAELVHDASSVTVYILDASAQKPQAVSAEVSINAMHDGKPEQFQLTASPEPSDPAGKASRYVSTDAELAAHIDDHASAAKLSVAIDGTPYRGDLVHDHDHEGHNHEGHDHEGHDHEHDEPAH